MKLKGERITYDAVKIYEKSDYHKEIIKSFQNKKNSVKRFYKNSLGTSHCGLVAYKGTDPPFFAICSIQSFVAL